MEEAKVKLRDMQNELPVKDNGFYLSLILGSNLNVSLLTKNERYRYKQEYEQFKYKVTFFIIITAIVSYFLPYRAVDSILNFLLVWYYCTLTIRESILQLNGSKIKGWWVLHHYISCALAGIVLTWKNDECYKSFRHQFIGFVIYLGVVQLAQRQYQLGTLRRLHALGQGHQMDITVEGFTSWQFKGLTFLLPFLLSGYVFQLYNAYVLYYLSFDCKGQWQVPALCYLFLFIAIGNIYTTSLVILRKLSSSQSYSTITGLTRKYRSRIHLNLMQYEHDHRE
ncbi:hypothetical protein WR25_15534 isoform A [Diploscapter pachys]|uniref:TMPIT-like protein n=1 Tax=Diploscapter pachys TaxID=2018661 RepID=A0A2A2JHR3_9BILA|nr:hypothetical protein WR25_15534 isoform A [Diploscapter pachys]